jgi:hypothetical protein
MSDADVSVPADSSSVPSPTVDSLRVAFSLDCTGAGVDADGLLVAFGSMLDIAPSDDD